MSFADPTPLSPLRPTSPSFSRILLFLIPFSLGSPGVFASQDTHQLYAPLLPDRVLNSADLLTLSQETIAAMGAIHPSLIYHYVDYLNTAYGGRHNISILQQQQALFGAQRIAYSQQKMDWYQTQLGDLKQKTRLTEYWGLKGIFDLNMTSQSLADSVAQRQVPTDANLNAYMTLLYESEEAQAPYDATSNYLESLSSHRDSLVQVYQELVTHYSHERRVRGAPLTQFVHRYWYLFDVEGHFLHSSEAAIVDIVLTQYRQRFQEDSQFQLSWLTLASLQPSPFISGKSETIYLRAIKYGRVELDLPETFVVLGYQQKLRPYKAPFSSLSLHLGMALPTDFHDHDFSSQDTFRYDYGGGVFLVEEVDFSRFAFTNISHSSWYLDLTTPLWFVNPKLSLDLGYVFRQDVLTYDFETSESFHKYWDNDGYIQEMRTGTNELVVETREQREEKHYLSLQVRYRLLRYVTLVGEHGNGESQVRLLFTL